VAFLITHDTRWPPTDDTERCRVILFLQLVPPPVLRIWIAFVESDVLIFCILCGKHRDAVTDQHEIHARFWLFRFADFDARARRMRSDRLRKCGVHCQPSLPISSNSSFLAVVSRQSEAISIKVNRK
jgi:hypothetical protein